MPIKVIAKGWVLVLIFLATFCSLLRGEEAPKNNNAVNLRRAAISAGPNGHAPLAPGVVGANPDLMILEHANLTLNQLAFAKFQFPTLDKGELIEKFRDLVTEVRNDYSARSQLSMKGFTRDPLQKLWIMNREIGIVASSLELSGSEVQKDIQKTRKDSIVANSAALEKLVRTKLNNDALTKISEELKFNLEVMKKLLEIHKFPLLTGKDAETVSIYAKALKDLEVVVEGGSPKIEKFFLKDILELNAKAEKILTPLLKDSVNLQDRLTRDGLKQLHTQLTDVLKD